MTTITTTGETTAQKPITRYEIREAIVATIRELEPRQRKGWIHPAHCLASTRHTADATLVRIAGATYDTIILEGIDVLGDVVAVIRSIAEASHLSFVEDVVKITQEVFQVAEGFLHTSDPATFTRVPKKLTRDVVDAALAQLLCHYAPANLRGANYLTPGSMPLTIERILTCYNWKIVPLTDEQIKQLFLHEVRAQYGVLAKMEAEEVEQFHIHGQNVWDFVYHVNEVAGEIGWGIGQGVKLDVRNRNELKRSGVTVRELVAGVQDFYKNPPKPQRVEYCGF